jgi:hypothetical protein
MPDFERRGKRRAMLSQTVRVRPSQPGGRDFDEVLTTINISRDGIYFSSDTNSYFKGQRLFITMPYSGVAGAVNPEYIGEVVRVDSLPQKRQGIAVHLVTSVNLKTN